MTELELVANCRAGDRDAQRELYDRTSQRIYRVLLRIVRNADDAFDLAQDTYLKAYAQVGRFDGRSALATWLYRIAVNEALQFLRRSKRTRALPHSAALDSAAPDYTKRHEARVDVDEALGALGATDRAMLLLRYQEGLDYREIAHITGCAEGTVASRLNRARDRLRGILQESYAWEEGSSAVKHRKVTET